MLTQNRATVQLFGSGRIQDSTVFELPLSIIFSQSTGMYCCVNHSYNKKNSAYSLLGPALKSAQRQICLNFSTVTHVVKNQIKWVIIY